MSSSPNLNLKTLVKGITLTCGLLGLTWNFIPITSAAANSSHFLRLEESTFATPEYDEETGMFKPSPITRVKHLLPYQRTTPQVDWPFQPSITTVDRCLVFELSSTFIACFYEFYASALGKQGVDEEALPYLKIAPNQTSSPFDELIREGAFQIATAFKEKFETLDGLLFQAKPFAQHWLSNNKTFCSDSYVNSPGVTHSIEMQLSPTVTYQDTGEVAFQMNDLISAEMLQRHLGTIADKAQAWREEREKQIKIRDANNLAYEKQRKEQEARQETDRLALEARLKKEQEARILALENQYRRELLCGTPLKKLQKRLRSKSTLNNDEVIALEKIIAVELEKPQNLKPTRGFFSQLFGSSSTHTYKEITQPAELGNRTKAMEIEDKEEEALETQNLPAYQNHIWTRP